MDKTELYIKMCEKATEIQDRKRGFVHGDFLWRGKKYLREVAVCDTVIHFKDDEIWIPRQDQLQEIYKIKAYNKDDPIGDLLGDLVYWIEHESDGGFGHSEDGYAFYFENSQLKSMEQLWLAFVMKENYNKVWDGEEWVES